MAWLYIISACIVLFLSYVLWCLFDGIYTLLSRRRIEANRQKAKQALSLVVTSRTDHSDDLFSVVLSHPKGKRLPGFQAGQYLSLMAAIGDGNKPISRRYSLAQWQAHPTHYQLGIRKVDAGQLSSWLHQHLQAGARISALPPAGHFTLQQALADKSTMHIVLIGAGIGITPMKAMLDKLQHVRQRVHLFHAAKTENELLWFQEFKALAQANARFSYHPYLSQANERWSGLRGRIQADDLINAGITIDTTHVFICAKTDMMLNIEQTLIELGVPANHIHWESFGAGLANQDQHSYQVSIDGYGDFAFSGEVSLLQAMESWRIPIAADCRAGECGECAVRITQGQYKTIQPMACGDVPQKTLACCVVPATDLTIQIHQATA